MRALVRSLTLPPTMDSISMWMYGLKLLWVQTLNRVLEVRIIFLVAGLSTLSSDLHMKQLNRYFLMCLWAKTRAASELTWW